MPIMLTATLAVSAQVMKIVTGVGYLVLALFVLIIAVSIIRKSFGDTSHPLELDGFSISELQQLHDQGQITTAEFKRAKLSVVNQNRRSLESQDKSEKP